MDAEVAAREALRQSEARYRLLAENASDVVFQSDLAGFITWVSPSVTRVLGWEPEEVVGGHHNVLSHPDDVIDEGATVQEILGGADHGAFDVRLRTRSGDYLAFAMSLHVVPADGADGPTIVGSLRSIATEPHEA